MYQVAVYVPTCVFWEKGSHFLDGLCKPHKIQDHWFRKQQQQNQDSLFSSFVTHMSTSCFFLILLKIGPGLILNMSPGTVVCHVGDKMDNLDPS